MVFLGAAWIFWVVARELLCSCIAKVFWVVARELLCSCYSVLGG